MLLATCYLLLCSLLLPTRYVCDSYTILIAVFALLRLPLSGIPHQVHVHRHALFELQSQRRTSRARALSLNLVATYSDSVFVSEKAGTIR